MKKRIGVGVGVAVLKDGLVLLGRRKGAHGAGHWAFPGGNLDWGESIEDCARREVFEETGLTLGPIRPIKFTNDLFRGEGLHYVTLFVAAEVQGGMLENREPDKCEGWSWYSWNAMPRPLFLPLANLVAGGYDPFL